MYHSRTTRRSATWWVRPLLLTLILFAAIASGVSPHFNRPVAALSSDIVISQVYGGGGAVSGSTYTNDFVELFNRGATAVDLTGWSIQYASATGTGLFGSSTSSLTPLSGTLQPGQYLLVEGANSTSTPSGGPLPTPDVTDASPINLGGSSGKVVLVTDSTSLGCNGGSTPCDVGQSARIKDLVGYGAGAVSPPNFFEGVAPAPEPAPSGTNGVQRADNGCTETDENGADFFEAAPSPRNTASPLNSCYPETVIDSNPSDPSNDPNPSFAFSSADAGSTFECDLDGLGWAACTSPQPYTGLADGSHTFSVRATNTRGNTDQTPASYTWMIDTTPPDTTIDSYPSDPSNSADPSFTFSANEAGSTFECDLDGLGWAACTSPQAYTGLSDGSHTFSVRATDAAANTDPTPASYTWMIDTTPPDTTPPETMIDSNPPDPSNSAAPSFTFSANEAGSTFECRLDGGSWVACASPQNYTGLADGSHTFDVRATDAAGNTDPTPASYTWLIDTTPPSSTTILVSTQTAGNIGSLSFGSEDILRWDGSGWSIWFDGSAAGLSAMRAKHNINAFWTPDPNGASVILAFAQNRRHVPDLAEPVDGMDLVRWDGVHFTFYFDGSDVGLKSKTQEKIDALHILPGSASPINGGNCLAYLLISTQGPGKVPNYDGSQLKFGGEDVLGFCATTLGDNTTGLWHKLLDGSDEGMPVGSLVDLSASDDGQVLYLTTRSTFIVDAAAGGHSVVYRYDRLTGLFSGPYFSAPATGLNERLDGLQVVGSLP